MAMNVHAFILKWSRAALTERSASQQHFLDLCEVLPGTTSEAITLEAASRVAAIGNEGPGRDASASYILELTAQLTGAGEVRLRRRRL